MSSFPKFLPARIEFFGFGCQLQVSVPRHLGTAPFWSPMSTGDMPIGWVRFEFVAIVEGEPVFAATGLRPAHDEPPPTGDIWPLFFTSAKHDR